MGAEALCLFIMKPASRASAEKVPLFQRHVGPSGKSFLMLTVLVPELSSPSSEREGRGERGRRGEDWISGPLAMRLVPTLLRQ